jgi:hypothetical protein
VENFDFQFVREMLGAADAVSVCRLLDSLVSEFDRILPQVRSHRRAERYWLWRERLCRAKEVAEDGAESEPGDIPSVDPLEIEIAVRQVVASGWVETFLVMLTEDLECASIVTAASWMDEAAAMLRGESAYWEMEIREDDLAARPRLRQRVARALGMLFSGWRHRAALPS